MQMLKLVEAGENMQSARRSVPSAMNSSHTAPALPDPDELLNKGLDLCEKALKLAHIAAELEWPAQCDDTSLQGIRIKSALLDACQKNLNDALQVVSAINRESISKFVR
jgi:hypothetical protein